MNIMDVKLDKMQIISLQNICKKGWEGYSKPPDSLDVMVENGLLTREDGPFCDVVYRPTLPGVVILTCSNNEKRKQVSPLPQKIIFQPYQYKYYERLHNSSQ
ncbi:hypothetical protein [Bacteroides fragilis]|uniref:hypothetical protein n=1 Tax=Bacteroides fragilis TaxID=817 RepID=UPI00202DE82D|nr:hypothetical protein [Bacteroides fragilis]